MFCFHCYEVAASNIYYYSSLFHGKNQFIHRFLFNAFNICYLAYGYSKSELNLENSIFTSKPLYKTGSQIENFDSRIK